MRHDEREISECYKQVLKNRTLIKEDVGQTADEYEGAVNIVQMHLDEAARTSRGAHTLVNIILERWQADEDSYMEQFYGQAGSGGSPSMDQPPMANPDDGIEGDSGEFVADADEPPPGVTENF